MRMMDETFLDTLGHAYKESVGIRPALTRQILSACVELGVIRLDSEEEPESWITVNGNHIPLDKEGVAMGGAGGWAEGKDFGEAKTVDATGREHKVTTISKRNFRMETSKRVINGRIQEVWDELERASKDGASDEYYNDANAKLVKILDELPPGSKVKEPDEWKDDYGNEKPYAWVKDEDGYWRSNYGGSSRASNIADSLLSGTRDDHPFVSSVARSEESKKASLAKQDKEYFRNNATIWSKRGGSANFDDHMKVKLNVQDRQRIGDGYNLVGADGRTYTRSGGEWVDSETWQRADMRTLRNAKLDGDYFDVAFGLNGFSKDAVDRIRQTYNGMPENVKRRYEDVFREVKSELTYPGVTSHYSPYKGTVAFDDPGDSDDVAFHEFSHALDDNVWLANGNHPYQELEKAHTHDTYHKEVGRVAELLGIVLNEDGWFKDDQSSPEYFDNYVKKYLHYATGASSKIPGFACVSDVISGISHGTLMEEMYGGHSSSYWSQPYSRSMEYWAEFCQLKIYGHNEALALLKQITPERYETAERIWREVFENDR